MRNKKLKDIKLPIMQCDRHCDDCCGVVGCSNEDYDRVIQYAKHNGIEPVKQGTKCVWYQDGQCAVYPARPFVCRVFGHFPELKCPHGYNVNVSEEMREKLERRFKFSKSPNDIRVLHEACFSLDEITTIVELSMES